MPVKIEPSTLAFTHPNFGTGKLTAELNVDPSGNGLGSMDVAAPDGRKGAVQLMPQDNGNLIVQISLASNSPVRVIVTDETGVILDRQ